MVASGVHPAMLAYVCGGLVVTGGTRKKGFQEESEAMSGPVELAQVPPAAGATTTV